MEPSFDEIVDVMRAQAVEGLGEPNLVAPSFLWGGFRRAVQLEASPDLAKLLGTKDISRYVGLPHVKVWETYPQWFANWRDLAKWDPMGYGRAATASGPASYMVVLRTIRAFAVTLEQLAYVLIIRRRWPSPWKLGFRHYYQFESTFMLKPGEADRIVEIEFLGRRVRVWTEPRAYYTSGGELVHKLQELHFQVL